MSGRRLLDAAAIFKASRAVAFKHLAFRTHQFDAYNKTSSLARAVKNQTNRITLTARAASALSKRLNGQGNGYSTQSSQPRATSQNAPVPSQSSVAGTPLDDKDKQGLEQDHFYEKSERNTTVRPVPESNIEVKQEQAKVQPLPDGSIPPAGADFGKQVVRPEKSTDSPLNETNIENVRRPTAERNDEQLGANRSSPKVPKEGLMTSQGSPTLTADQARKLQRNAEHQIPSQAAEPPPVRSSTAESSGVVNPQKGSIGEEQDVFHSRPNSSETVLSALPRVKVPKATGDTQESNLRVPDEQINQDVFYSSTGQGGGTAIPSTQAVPEQDEPSDDMYSEIFQSPKVAKLLKGQPRPGQQTKGLDPQSAKVAPSWEKKSPGEKDSVSSSERITSSVSKETTEQKDSRGAASEQQPGEDDARELAEDMAKDAGLAKEIPQDIGANPTPARYEMRESRVPSSRFGRLWQYGGLATSMAFGAVGETVRRATGSSDGAGGSLMLSASNMERLVAKLSRMRGAALKLGQMMSFQDSKMLPGPINEVLQRVQDSADYMPASQRNKVLSSNLGSDWRDLFSSFDEKPIAAASIGQVHRAVLKSNGVPVAIKVQYPGVANSIDSDLNNLSILLTASRLLPKGLYLDKTIANARTELAWECDYVREAEAGRRFQQLLRDEKDTFVVPSIFDEASGPQVLTMEMMNGIGVTKVQNFTHDQKDWIGTQILRLCLREITEFKYMQTDPNWTNFLFNAETNKLELLDFGASREYPDKFILPYIKVLLAASRSKRDSVRDLSIQLGYLTGHESSTMLNAHINSVLTLAEPFSDKSPETYDFRDQTITERVRGLIPVMVRERLAPPPEETYSLHRKLSGAFLLCARLGSRVKCREMFSNAMAKAGVA